MPYTTIRVLSENQRQVDDLLHLMKEHNRSWSASAIINLALVQFFERGKVKVTDIEIYNNQLERERNGNDNKN